MPRGKGLKVYVSMIEGLTDNVLRGTLVFENDNSDLGEIVLDRINDFDMRYGEQGLGWREDIGKENKNKMLKKSRYRRLKYHPVFIKVV